MGRLCLALITTCVAASLVGCAGTGQPRTQAAVSAPVSAASTELPDPHLGTAEMREATRLALAQEIGFLGEGVSKRKRAALSQCTAGNPLPLRDPSVADTQTALSGYFVGKAPRWYLVPVLLRDQLVGEFILVGKKGKVYRGQFSSGADSSLRLISAQAALRRVLGPDAVIAYAGGPMGPGTVVGWSERGEGLVFAYFYCGTPWSGRYPTPEEGVVYTGEQARAYAAANWVARPGGSLDATALTW